MMANLVRHVERLIAERQRLQVNAVAAELEDLLRNASVEIEGTKVIARGSGLARQWLGDPRLRFLGKQR